MIGLSGPLLQSALEFGQLCGGEAADGTRSQLYTEPGVHHRYYADGQHVLEHHREDRVVASAVLYGPLLNAKVHRFEEGEFWKKKIII